MILKLNFLKTLKLLSHDKMKFQLIKFKNFHNNLLIFLISYNHHFIFIKFIILNPNHTININYLYYHT